MQNIASDISVATASSLLKYFSGREGDILSLTRDLVELESPSGDESGSRAVVELLARTAEEIEGVFSIERIRSPGYGEHLLVRAFANSDKTLGKILLVGHTDTVHALGSLGKRPWRAEDNRIYAPGIFDMKANCVLALEALRRLSCD